MSTVIQAISSVNVVTLLNEEPCELKWNIHVEVKITQIIDYLNAFAQTNECKQIFRKRLVCLLKSPLLRINFPSPFIQTDFYLLALVLIG